MAPAGERAFSGARLRLARAFAGLTQAELGGRVAVSHQFVGYLETGHKEPTGILVEALGEACDFEPSFFFGPPLDEFRDEECQFRRRQTTPVSVRTKVLAYGTLFGQLVEVLDDSLALPAMRVPEARVHGREDIEAAAERCRVEWGLGRDLPIKNMTRALENAGVVVARFEGAAEKIDAFSRAGRRSIVVLNTDKGSASRTRFDMAHECGHLVMHGGLVTGDVVREREADHFASAFLLPRSGFLREFPRSGRVDWSAMFHLKKRWGTSVAALVHRAYDLRLINAIQYQRAFKYLSAQGWRKGEPEEPQPETPELIPLSLQALHREGMEPRLLAARLGWTRATFERVSGVPLVHEDLESENRRSGTVIHLPLKP